MTFWPSWHSPEAFARMAALAEHKALDQIFSSPAVWQSGMWIFYGGTTSMDRRTRSGEIAARCVPKARSDALP
jgi:hypothetical protein